MKRHFRDLDQMARTRQKQTLSATMRDLWPRLKVTPIRDWQLILDEANHGYGPYGGPYRMPRPDELPKDFVPVP